MRARREYCYNNQYNEYYSKQILDYTKAKMKSKVIESVLYNFINNRM